MTVQKTSLHKRALLHYGRHVQGLTGPAGAQTEEKRNAVFSAARWKSFLSTTFLCGMTGAAGAQDAASFATGSFLSSTEMVIYALFAGALGATLFSVARLLRQRSQTEKESDGFRLALSEANRKISHYQALVADRNRRIVIWTAGASRPEFIGQLPPESGAPQTDIDFLAFGRWLRSGSASELEKGIENLRSSGHSFDMVIETTRDDVLEVQGRVSGDRAFVRFIALSNLRTELAELKIERERLTTAVNTFQTLLDTLDQPAWMRDAEGKLAWVNHAYGSAVETATPQQAVSEQREFLNTVTRHKIQALSTPHSPFHDRVSAVVAGNRGFFDVLDIRTQGGSAGIAIDISEAEEAREELKRTLKSHAETLDHLATPVAIFDGERRLQFYNQAFVSLWQLDIGLLESKPTNSELLDLLRSAHKLPEQLSWKSWKEAALAVYRSTETHTDLWHLPNGQTLRVFATAHPQGGATWVFENLTEQVDLQTRYNTLVKVQGETIDHLSEGVAVFGADGRIRLSNPAFRALWAISEENARSGTHIASIEKLCAPSYDQPDGWKRFGQLITSFEDERPSYEGTLELHSGLVLDYSVIPLPNAQTMLTFVNMTDSVRAERALKEKNEALRKADELKNHFVQHVSYELRSPLTNIIGFTDLLKTPSIGPLNERQAEYIDHISTSSAVLLTIVNDILDLATVDAGIMELNYAHYSLNDLLEEVTVQIAGRLQENNVTLEINAPADLGTIFADYQRMKQIFIKILTNAANFAPEGSSITLACRREQGNFTFSVTDRGPGIAEEVLPRVFDRFATGNRAGKRTGAGLGLAIVESFVNLHHGEVWIDSGAGQGTTVVCRIPLNGSPHSSIAAE